MIKAKYDIKMRMNIHNEEKYNYKAIKMGQIMYERDGYIATKDHLITEIGSSMAKMMFEYTDDLSIA